MTLSRIAKKAVQILNEDSTRKIRFHLGGLTISSEELGRVAHAIETGAITVVHNPRLAVGHAQYDPNDDTIILKSDEMGDRYEHTVSSKIERSFMIHECTHAAIDLIKAKSTRRLANEAAAYLAQALYLYQELGDVAYRYFIDKGVFPEEIHRTSVALIERYKLLSRDFYLVDPHYKPLLRAVKRREPYKEVPWAQTEGSDANGVRAVPSARRSGGCEYSIRPAIAVPRSQWMETNRPLAYQQHLNNVKLLRQAVQQQFGGQADPYAADTWRHLERVRPAQRAQWMETNRPLAYQQHLNNVKLLRQAVQQQLR